MIHFQAAIKLNFLKLSGTFSTINTFTGLLDATTTLTGQVLGLEVNVAALDQRGGDLEAGGGGDNVTGTKKTQTISK